ncbi:MAG: 16S rRNA (cytosine(1402)-N(4))-methyltransferase RsmH [Bacteroidetes bacterium]|nr:16S rRNA (cytosine(1402)-N(4))-methyltransferase RsmH [Bacteroidota bacterium]
MVNKKHKQTQSTDPLPILPANTYHTAVLLREAISALNIIPDGTYVDCTFGGGSHSKEILKHLGENGRLFAFDQDADAARNLPDDKRLVFLPHNFRHLQRFLRLHQVQQVNGILADLGVSSHQFDEAKRGFSLRFEGDLDMRMDKRQSLTAFQIVNTYTEPQLHKLFEQYGEVTNSKSLAKKIVQVRHTVSMQKVNAFKHAVSDMVKGNPNKYFAQVFQALRIEVNDELGALKEMLQQSTKLLAKGGRIVIITFHSLEDRIVKNFFRQGSFDEERDENPFTSNTVEKELSVITKKPVVPGKTEIDQNPRSRSAKLRVAEKK